MLLELRLGLLAMTAVYICAHSTLVRPPSAAPAIARGRRRPDAHPDAVGKTQKKQRHVNANVPLLGMGDVILMPFSSAFFLIGYFYLLKWLDPAVFRRLFNLALVTVCFRAVGRVYAQAFQMVVSIVFPRWWRGGDGSLWEVVVVDGEADGEAAGSSRGLRKYKSSHIVSAGPLPGLLSRIPLADGVARRLWDARRHLRGDWCVRTVIRGQARWFYFKFSDMLGFCVAGLTTATYYIAPSRSLSNLFAVLFCLGLGDMVAIPSFVIAAGIMITLLCYDILMVFFTPFMQKVAMHLDGPVTIVFTEKTGDVVRKTIIGLGDITLPGLAISLALRFDLWRHFEKDVTYEPVSLRTESRDASGALVVTTESTKRTVKPAFVDPAGKWGDRFWTLGLISLGGRRRGGNKPASLATTAEESGNTTPLPRSLAVLGFPKTYFWASMAGYAVGIASAMTASAVAGRAQPALMYIVPGVCGAQWLTGWWRGELGLMMRYVEDGSLDTTDVVVDVGPDGKTVSEGEKEEKDGKDGKDGKEEKEEKEEENEKQKEEEKEIQTLTRIRTEAQAEIESDKTGQTEGAGGSKDEPESWDKIPFAFLLYSPLDDEALTD